MQVLQVECAILFTIRFLNGAEDFCLKLFSISRFSEAKLRLTKIKSNLFKMSKWKILKLNGRFLE